MIPQIFNLWNTRSKLKGLEWVISVDEGDVKSLEVAQRCAANPVGCTVKIAINHGSKDCNSGWNAACAETTGKVIIAVADDIVPPQDWDQLLLDIKPEGWVDGEYAVHVEDGYVHTIMVLPIITRKRYDKFGYLYYPKYRSMFNDTELTEVSGRDGVTIDAHHLLFEHMHPDCGKRPRDNVDLIHASKERWNASEMLFNFRKAHGFPIDDGPKAVKQDAAPVSSEELKFAVYMQVIKDDFCLWEVCERLMQEGCKDFFMAVPDEYWSGEPVKPEEADTLKPVFEKLMAAGARIQIKNFHVASYRVANDSRITIETRVRNDSLAWIRKQGFKHILIVDGDELWLPGTLDVIKPYINQGHTAISLRMIPVMGTPGYPVERAFDLAVVYIGSNCDFRCCRTPNVKQTILEVYTIIHFTSTRRTREENTLKHLRSGHYDDPEYAFDEYIEKVLPNVKPGFTHNWSHGGTGLHMYRKFQIWFSVRHWRPEEWAVLPESLKPYLGAPPA